MGDRLPDETSSNNGQEVVNALTISEALELNNIKAMRRSLAVIVDYLESRESVIFSAARTRIAEQGGRIDVR